MLRPPHDGKEQEMAETTIRAKEGLVVYTMEPYVADELAMILQETAMEADPFDHGWDDDARQLIQASNLAVDQYEAKHAR
jgi:hypothetical protein